MFAEQRQCTLFKLGESQIPFSELWSSNKNYSEYSKLQQAVKLTHHLALHFAIQSERKTGVESAAIVSASKISIMSMEGRVHACHGFLLA